jgi:fructose-1-phosphate kinase PfkB-like protein
MILNVTANPMMEHPFHQPRFEAAGDQSPQNPPIFMPTGEPINVAPTLKNLGKEVVYVVAVGGATSRGIEVRG